MYNSGYFNFAGLKVYDPFILSMKNCSLPYLVNLSSSILVSNFKGDDPFNVLSKLSGYKILTVTTNE